MGAKVRRLEGFCWVGALRVAGWEAHRGGECDVFLPRVSAIFFFPPTFTEPSRRYGHLTVALFHSNPTELGSNIQQLTFTKMGEQKKRKRASAPTKHSKRQKSNSNQGQVQKRVVSVDALAWRSVELPEMFDDAEGFYGLEEVEGVDVVRQGDIVQFVSPNGAFLELTPLVLSSV